MDHMLIWHVLKPLSKRSLAQSINSAQEHVGDLIASFQVSLVVGSWSFKKKTPHKKNYTFAFILLQGILYSGFHISGILLIVWTGKGHPV